MSLADAAPITSGERLAQLDIADDSSRGTSTPRAPAEAVSNADNKSPVPGDEKATSKLKKRSLFGFGKSKPTSDATTTPTVTTAAATATTPSGPSRTTPGTTRSTQSSQPDYSFPSPSSPNRAFSTSPRLSSPAGSQIFERDVQESIANIPNSPAIPTHIQTENHIPSVLDDASEAITNDKLDPDTVEIVTHSLHQPASVTVTGAANSPSDQQQSPTGWAAELASFAERIGVSAETASNYGSLESSDVRRLSFISFADVVQSEHSISLASPTSRDNMHLAGLASLPPSALNRSPSPIRSPVSSQGLGTSPPTSNPASMKGVDMSPPRKRIGSPKGGQHSLAAPGELNIETMRQALRRTGSTDLASARSMPTSPIDAPGSR
ncbi:hypothetical protein NQ176_g8875 [Zarea fungicola]|uniref:Uncharacterized protein n=1 Tax=Zarea fungicola TaxID=93591 RepID=A0ACC1MS07_9HYPO|nr:hypothetical protein NQ176_g8875 [Lecanicillium fungicola]